MDHLARGNEQVRKRGLPPLLTYRRQPESRILFDARGQFRSDDRLCPSEIKLGFLFCLLQQRLVTHDVSDAKLRQPGLSYPKELTRPAQLQILLGDDKSVSGFGHDPEPLLRI